ncbi:D-inositol-3-phosphate glycosyltransferase [Grimontia celer]|uniref:D-inositol-3-phosphate glycosyltransferase n=1 Tax=Grimontia celer TaxID=1796497 RepID=A0A128F0U3_9GAMM|nr:glycosyltransferase family 4 protein [Grimontia celer]CZF80040.1 D-inositol-3-phosphate glycosyltransferase [Grimontia celer]
MKKVKLFHIASDFPDHTGMNSTKAVANLLSATERDIDHQTIAYRRIRTSRFGYEKRDQYGYLQAPSLPLGLLHTFITLLSALILLRKRGHDVKSVDYIHAHKLTIDGLLAYFLSKFTGVKYAISVRADTDIKFIKNKPFSRWIFKKVYFNASKVFYVSAWGKHDIEKKLKVTKKDFKLLPNIVETPKLIERKENAIKNTNSNRFIFIGRMESARKKGLYDTLEALSTNKNFKLDIYGTADEESLSNLDSMTNLYGVSDQVNYCGKISKDELLEKLSEYCALVMPSVNETFGMVYVEALYCNLPIIHCKGSGIDGYVTGVEYIQSVESGNKDQISKSMNYLYRNQEKIKNKLEYDTKSGFLDVFSTNEISKSYLDSFGPTYEAN